MRRVATERSIASYKDKVFCGVVRRASSSAHARRKFQQRRMASKSGNKEIAGSGAAEIISMRAKASYAQRPYVKLAAKYSGDAENIGYHTLK